MLYPSLGIPLQAAVDLEDNRLAMGTFVFARQTGAVIGPALGAAVFSNSFTSSLPEALPSSLETLRSSNAALSLISDLRHLDLDPATLKPILDAYSKALKWVLVAMVVVAGIGLIASLAIRDITLENEERGRQAFVENEQSDMAPLFLQPLSRIETGTESGQDCNGHPQ